MVTGNGATGAEDVPFTEPLRQCAALRGIHDRAQPTHAGALYGAVFSVYRCGEPLLGGEMTRRPTCDLKFRVPGVVPAGTTIRKQLDPIRSYQDGAKRLIGIECLLC